MNINPLYTAHELEYALNKVKVKVLICPQTIGALDYGNILTELIPDLASRDRFNLKCKNIETLEKIIFYSSPSEFPGVLKWEELEQAAQQCDFKTLSEIKVE